jgi:beta-glucosidase
MKKVFAFLVFFFYLAFAYSNLQGNNMNQTVSTHTLPQEGKLYTDMSKSPPERAEAVLNKMTIEEKVQIIGGLDSFYISGIKRLGIPSLYLSDATQGVHIRENINTELEKSTAFPCALALAATFNLNLAEQYARSIGQEFRAGNIAFLLGPGMNIYRVSRCGRNFEYLGEDPYLASRMVETYVKSVQSVGVGTTLKHFICNQNEYYRRKCNVKVDERAIHEIYIPAFKAGVQAGSAAVMTSYNLVNNEWAGQSEYAIDKLLRNELGFDGLIMSDWWSVWHPEKYMTAKLDLKMPNGPDFETVKGLLDKGKIQMEDLDRKVKSILTTCFRMGFYDSPQRDECMLEKFPEHNEIALKTAQESIVLLENRDNLLPVSEKDNQSVMLVGYDSKEIAAGGGSGWVKGYGHITFFDAMKKRFGSKMGYLTDISNSKEEKEVKKSDVVVVCVAVKNSEDSDQSFFLPDIKDALIRKALELNEKTVVVLMTGTGVRMTDWNHKVGALLYCWYGGQNQGKSIVDVITGRVNPSGKLPITIEKEYSDSPGFGYFPEEFKPEKGDGNKDNIYSVEYDEGIFIGYRWYDEKKIEPLYPFGYGLSYTTFDYNDLKIEKENNEWKVSFTVTNTGNRSGAETVQLYVADVESYLPRPPKELKGFKKIFLDIGESKKIELTLANEDFSFYDPEKNQWVLEPGVFKLLAGSNCRDIRLTGELVI